MIIDDFLTMPSTWTSYSFKRPADYRTDDPKQSRIIQYRFYHHLQEVAKFPAIPFVFQNIYAASLVTVSKWPNGGEFIVGNSIIQNHLLYSSAYNEWAKTELVDAQLRKLCVWSQFHNRTSLMMTNIRNVGFVLINSNGVKSALTSDSERILRREYFGSE